MGMSLLQSILMNVEESERWYHELEEYQKRAEGSEAREARGRLITLDISLPTPRHHRNDGSAAGGGCAAYGPESTHPGTFRDQQSAIDDERWQRFLRVEPKR